MTPVASFCPPAWQHVPEHVGTYGAEVADLADAAGMTLDPEQRLVIDAMYAYDARGRLVAPEFGCSAPRQNVKALAVDTPILTGSGWSTMGELQVGDQVFHPDGHLVTVTATSPVRTGHQCYRVTSADGRSVVADAGHLWSVYDRRSEAHRVWTTEQLLRAGLERPTAGRRSVVTAGKTYSTRELRFRLPGQRALESKPVDLPLDPYLLGAWLGDGASRASRLYCHQDDVSHWTAAVSDAGFLPQVVDGGTCQVVCISVPPGVGRMSRAFTGKLRALGVFGAKHVPDDYLTAGTEQREALLQGLLDTDGTVSKRSGQVSFCSTSRLLAEGALYLVRSLGWRAGLRASRARLRGRDCGPQWNVTFTPKTSDPHRPFRMARKAQLVQDLDGGKGRRTLSLTSIEPVDSVPVRCIGVDSADGVFLAGRDLLPTHNSHVGKAAALADLVLFGEPDCLWTAHLRATSDDVFANAKGNGLQQMFESYDFLRRLVDTVEDNAGEKSITLRPQSVGGPRAKIAFVARSERGGRGLSGRKVTFDEALFLKPSMLSAMVPILSAQSMSGAVQVRYLGSPGLVSSASWREVRDRGRSGTATRLAWLEWAARKAPCEQERCPHVVGTQGCALDREDLVREANLAADRRIDVAFVLGTERPAMTPADYMRERLGWWDDPPHGGSGPIDAADWARRAVAEPRKPTRPVFGVALSMDQAHASIVACGDADGRAQLSVVEARPGTGWVVSRLAEVCRAADAPVALDKGGPAASLLRDLERERLRIVLLSTTEYAQACGALLNEVNDETVWHTADPALDDAVRDSSTRTLGERWAWARTGSTDISPLEAATVALHGFRTRPPGHLWGFFA